MSKASTMIVVPRGLPASGKSTWVKFELGLLMGADPLILSYDIYRKQEPFANMENWKEREKLVKAKLQEDLMAAISREEPLVALDNTNLSDRSLEKIRLAVSEYQKEVSKSGKPTPIVEFYVEDKFLDVPVLECIRRDTYREEEKRVGPEVIFRLDKAARGLRQRRSLNVRKAHCESHAYATDKPRCIIVDLDGTLALLGDRSPFDGSKVGGDSPNTAVIGIVRDWILCRRRNSPTGTTTPHVFFFTGRENQDVTLPDGSQSNVKLLTEQWIRTHVIDDELDEEMVMVGMEHSLHIRAKEDHRPDDVVKLEMFNSVMFPDEESIADPEYKVDFVLDDRNSVVQMWRTKLGLPCLQVAEGDF